MQFGKNLKSLLKQRKFKQNEFAEMLETGNTSISNWINGTSYPEFKTLLRIAEMLSVDLDTLVYGEIDDNSINLISNKMKNEDANIVVTANGNKNRQTINSFEKDLYERLLKDREEQISFLREQLKEKSKLNQ